MFARIKKSGAHQYLQIVENRREGPKTIQRVIATLGRMDHLQEKGEIENLVRSLSRFSEKVLLVLSGQGDIQASAKKIGPPLIFETALGGGGNRSDPGSSSARKEVWL